MALVATVVPCITERISDGFTPEILHSLSIPLSTAIDGSCGVEGTLAVKLSPVASFIRSRSVNVPPTSAPRRKLMLPPTLLLDLYRAIWSRGWHPGLQISERLAPARAKLCRHRRHQVCSGAAHPR